MCMSDIIICRLDGKEMSVKNLARHLKIYHQKDYKEYIQEHIEDFKEHGWDLCTICFSPVKGKACSGECIRKHYSNIRMGISNGPMSEETKRKLSENRRQKYANGWAPRIGKFHTEKSKEKNALSHLGKKMPSISGNLNPACRPEVRKKISKSHIGLQAGEKNGMFGKTHTPEAIKKIFSHRKMNKLEKMIADQFDSNGIGYYFQFFIIEGNICKSYDFKIKGKPLIIEVDGDFWHGNPKQKNHYERVDEVKINDLMKDLMALDRGYKVVRLWESDIRKDPSIVLKYVLG